MNKATTENHQVARHACEVLMVKPLSTDTFQVELQSTEVSALSYKAGQYLQLSLDVNCDGELMSLSYSIANNFDPKQPNRLQLFIHNNSAFSDKVLKRLSAIAKNHEKVNVNLPLGQAFLQTDLNLPHILIAAGSGISKIKCVTEAILKQQPNAEIKIYWSNKKADDFYLLELFQHWQNTSSHLNFTTILESATASWSGRTGFIYEVIKQDVFNLIDAQVYLCGSPKMVYGTIDEHKAIGLKERNCYSDVFEYAPREQKIAM
jgi:CDP-4-dehydro-6-deoxyglucose reductase